MHVSKNIPPHPDPAATERGNRRQSRQTHEHGQSSATDAFERASQEPLPHKPTRIGVPLRRSLRDVDQNRSLFKPPISARTIRHPNTLSSDGIAFRETRGGLGSQIEAPASHGSQQILTQVDPPARSHGDEPLAIPPFNYDDFLVSYIPEDRDSLTLLDDLLTFDMPDESDRDAVLSSPTNGPADRALNDPEHSLSHDRSKRPAASPGEKSNTPGAPRNELSAAASHETQRCVGASGSVPAAHDAGFASIPFAGEHNEERTEAKKHSLGFDSEPSFSKRRRTGLRKPRDANKLLAFAWNGQEKASQESIDKNVATSMTRDRRLESLSDTGGFRQDERRNGPESERSESPSLRRSPGQPSRRPQNRARPFDFPDGPAHDSSDEQSGSRSSETKSPSSPQSSEQSPVRFCAVTDNVRDSFQRFYKLNRAKSNLVNLVKLFNSQNQTNVVRTTASRWVKKQNALEGIPDPRDNRRRIKERFLEFCRNHPELSTSAAIEAFNGSVKSKDKVTQRTGHGWVHLQKSSQEPELQSPSKIASDFVAFHKKHPGRAVDKSLELFNVKKGTKPSRSQAHAWVRMHDIGQKMAAEAQWAETQGRFLQFYDKQLGKPEARVLELFNEKYDTDLKLKTVQEWVTMHRIAKERKIKEKQTIDEVSSEASTRPARRPSR